MVAKFFIVAFVKFSSALALLAMTASVTRVLGANDAGFFLLAISLLTAMAIFFRLGLDNLLIRQFGTSGANSETIASFNVGLRWVVSAVFPVAVLLILFSDFISVYIFSKPEFSNVFAYAMLTLPFLTLGTLFAPVFQGIKRLALAVFFQTLGVPLVFLFIFLLLNVWSEDYLSVEWTILVYAGSSFLIFCFAVCMWKRIPGVVIKKMPFRNSAMWSASSNMWVVNIMSLIVDYSGVLVAGALVASQELAYLFSAQRTALLVSFVLVVVNTVVAPHYARLWNTGDLKSIQYTAKQSTRVMAISALLIVLLMSFFSGLIMSLFGEGFEQGAKLLVILAIGQLVNVTTGSVGYLLTMTGHERDMRQVSIISGPITVICAVWFTVCWGVTGAACATALGLSLKNLGALLMVKRRLGFWPLG